MSLALFCDYGSLLTQLPLVPARRSRAGASDSDRGAVDGVSSDINSFIIYPSKTYLSSQRELVIEQRASGFSQCFMMS